MQRRDFLKTFGLTTGSLAAMGLMKGGLPALAADAKRPNIIMFLIDDMDFESVGCYGYKGPYTPNLDRMAREGIRFTRACATSAVCTPSRYSFLTGRYPGDSTSKLYRSFVGTDRQGYPDFNMALESDKMNVGAVLSAAGYVTGFTGKFHVASKEDFPERYEGGNAPISVPKKSTPSPQYSAAFKHNEKWMCEYVKNLGFTWAKHVYEGNLQAPYDNHNPEYTIAAVHEFLETHKDKPFYLHVTPTLLHGGPNSWAKSFHAVPTFSAEGEIPADPLVVADRKNLLAELKAHGVDVNDNQRLGEAWIDRNLGKVFSKLKELGIDGNTLVIFSPDQGRDGKGSAYSHDAIRIPMIMRWPKGIEPGLVCEELVQSIDLAPTFFELAGAKVPQDYLLRGRSLTPLLQTGKAPADWRESLYYEMGVARGVETKDWKYIAMRYTKDQIKIIKDVKMPEQYPCNMAPTMKIGIGTRGAVNHKAFWEYDQLYDLRVDPKEQKDLAKDPKHAEQLKKMKALLTDYVKLQGRPCGEFVPGTDTAPPGQVDDEIAKVRRMEIKGKNVVLPKDLAGGKDPVRSGNPDRGARRLSLSGKSE